MLIDAVIGVIELEDNLGFVNEVIRGWLLFEREFWRTFVGLGLDFLLGTGAGRIWGIGAG